VSLRTKTHIRNYCAARPVQLLFSTTMDRPSAPFVLAVFSGLLLLSGCGDASAPGIDGPGVHGTATTPTTDAGADVAPKPAPLQAYCTAPNAICNGACTAIGSDPSNCGACGNACLGTDSICLAGQCSCSGPELDYCDDVGCMDVSSDFNNCGACGYMCDPNNDQACANGQCVPNDP
jgi:hypothetical protein